MSLPSSGTLNLSTINQYLRFTNGNIGIGTTSPGYALDITGNINGLNINKNGVDFFKKYNPVITYNTTATLTVTEPSDIVVSGQIGDVTIAMPTANSSGNTITIHNVGGTMGNYNSSVFVRMGTSSTSGSIARLAQGDSITTMALDSMGTTPQRYQDTIVRKGYGGINWTLRASVIPVGRSWNSICWAAELGLFCAVNQNSAAVVVTSPDGITWTERAIPNSRAWVSVCWSAELGLFCAVNQNSAAFVMTSPDGITWTERSTPATRSWYGICWAPELGLFCAVGTAIMTSPNGTTWTERSRPIAAGLYTGVCWAAELGLFVGVRYTDASVMTSSDGITWTSRAIPTSRQWWDVCWAAELGLFVALEFNSAAVVMTSPDGITWTERSIPNIRAWSSVCWSNELSLFCAVSSSFVMTSPDGITWTERSISTAPNTICWSPELMTFCTIASASALTSFR